MKKIILTIVGVIILIVLTLFLFSFFRQPRVTELGNMDYEELCKVNKNMWMEMEPYRNGKKISEEKCFGCMIGVNHFCKAEEYIYYIKDLSNKEETNDMMMVHNTMTAHAGNKNSVDVYTYNVGFSKNKVNENLYNLVFTIKDIISGEFVADLDTVHDKIMHVVLVKNDLKYFDHIHPQQVDGKFIVPYYFFSPGNYRIWIDFTIDGMQHIVDFDTNIENVKRISEPDKIYGLNVEMNLQKKEIGETSKIEFLVTDLNNKPIPIIEKFLAASAHMIVIDKSLDEFGHAHDGEFNKDNVLSFEYEFKNKGIHKLWLQFSTNGNIITKEFEVLV